MSDTHDDPLGMHRRIARRDFINGVLGTTTALGIGGVVPLSALASGGPAGSVRAPVAVQPPPAADGDYPPAKTGMRGSGYTRAYETGHSLRDGTLVLDDSAVIDTGETHDLLVVGGGLSGLAAAYYYRKMQGADSRMLVMDNHDDFGGHAKRNEFEYGGRTMISNAGTFDLATDGSELVARLLEEIGLPDLRELNRTTVDPGFYGRHGMGQSVYFDRETFGEDKLVPDPGPWTEYKPLYEPNVPFDTDKRWETFFREAPLSAHAKRDVHRMYTAQIEYFPNLAPAERERALRKMTYETFLRDVAKVDPMAIAFQRDRTFGSARGMSGMSAWAARRRGMPGFLGIDAGPGNPVPRPKASKPGAPRELSDKYHFPDGNATLARLMVRQLIPAAVPGSSVEDSIGARVRYDLLDRPENPGRIRLNSTVVRVANTATGVEVVYSRDGKLYRVRGRHAIMACWHSVIPYICPELPDWQKEALSYCVKAPNLWVNVWLRNWEAFRKAGACFINAPNGYYTQMILEHPITIGSYRHATAPDQPTKLTMLRGYETPGLPTKDQYRAGRAELYATDFATFEYEAREQLGRMLGPYGFDPAEDIVGMTVNRWGHGYCYMYSDIFDEFLERGEQPPHERARQRYGNIAIANTDAAGVGSTSCAIDQAHRAVSEILAYRLPGIFY